MTNVALLLLSFSAANLVSFGLCQDSAANTETPAPPHEASSNDSAESSSSTSQEVKEAGSNRILNYGESPVGGGGGFGAYPSSSSQILPTLEYPVQASSYPSYKPYQPLQHHGYGGGYPQHPYKNIGCKYYCPGRYPGSFYCCKKAPSYGGYYCPWTRQSCPARSRHGAPRSCIQDENCHFGQKCCLDLCVGYHVCKATEW